MCHGLSRVSVWLIQSLSTHRNSASFPKASTQGRVTISINIGSPSCLPFAGFGILNVDLGTAQLVHETPIQGYDTVAYRPFGNLLSLVDDEDPLFNKLPAIKKSEGVWCGESRDIKECAYQI